MGGMKDSGMSRHEAQALWEAELKAARKDRFDPDWNRYAVIYDGTVGQLIPYKRLIRDVVICAGLHQGMIIVDAATGTGNLLVQAASQTAGLRMHGVENSPGMLSVVRAKFLKEPRVKIHDADLNNPSWVDVIGEGKADVVMSVNTLYTMNNPVAFFEDVRRLLKRGGRFVVSNPTTRELSPIMFEHLMMRGDLTPLMREMIEINMDITHWGQATEATYHFLSRQEVLDALDVARFKIDLCESAYSDVNVTVVATAL